MKIHQQSDAEMAHAQIGQKLRFVRRDEGRNAFDLYDHSIRDHNIRPKSDRDRRAFVNHRNTDLTPKRNAGAFEFEAKAGLVNRFQKSRPYRR
jgi:hypothetical protein